jgi:glycosyltransferase involved in cell wall biosynthesis
MKIVYYLPKVILSRGMERITILKANYFAETFGYSVVLLTTEQRNHKPAYPISDKVTHLDLNVNFDDDNKLWKLITYPYKYFLFRKRLHKFINCFKPDIFVSTLWIWKELRVITHLKDGSKKVGELHSGTWNQRHRFFLKNPLVKFFKKWEFNIMVNNIKKLDKFVVLTHEEAELWTGLSNLTVIPNFITIPAPQQPSDVTSRRIVSVGAFSYEKGFDLLIDAWNIIAAKYPEWKLIIHGKGEQSPYMEQINRYRLNDAVVIDTSYVSDLSEIYRNGSIYVLSSRKEGMPLVMIEAMSCGLPVVSFACKTGPKDIISDGEDGFLVESENIRQLAEKIEYLIENEDIRKEMGRKALLKSNRYKIENIAGKWVQLFQSLVTGTDAKND